MIEVKKDMLVHKNEGKNEPLIHQKAQQIKILIAAPKKTENKQAYFFLWYILSSLNSVSDCKAGLANLSYIREISICSLFS